MHLLRPPGRPRRSAVADRSAAFGLALAAATAFGLGPAHAQDLGPYRLDQATERLYPPPTIRPDMLPLPPGEALVPPGEETPAPGLIGTVPASRPTAWSPSDAATERRMPMPATVAPARPADAFVPGAYADQGTFVDQGTVHPAFKPYQSPYPPVEERLRRVQAAAAERAAQRRLHLSTMEMLGISPGRPTVPVTDGHYNSQLWKARIHTVIVSPGVPE